MKELANIARTLFMLSAKTPVSRALSIKSMGKPLIVSMQDWRRNYHRDDKIESDTSLQRALKHPLSSTSMMLLVIPAGVEQHPRGMQPVSTFQNDDLYYAAKDEGFDAEKLRITKENIWIKNIAGYSPMDLAFKYHNVRFITLVKEILGDQIEKQPFECHIASILDVDPDAISIMSLVEEFYENIQEFEEKALALSVTLTAPR